MRPSFTWRTLPPIAAGVIALAMIRPEVAASHLPGEGQKSTSQAAPALDAVVGEEIAAMTAAPFVPAPIQRKHATKVLLNIEVREHTKALADGVNYTYWTFGDDAPGNFIRLREGEVNILGGLSSSQDSTTFGGIPGLVNIPVLGRLLGSDHNDKIRSELMIALVPHIVRTPGYTAENLRGIYAGTDQVVKINYAAKGDPTTGTVLSPVPASASVASAVPQTIAPTAATPSVQLFPLPATATAAPGRALQVSFSPGVVQAANGAKVAVSIQVENGANLNAVAPLRIKYDADLLRLDDIVPGDIFSRGGAANATKDIRNDAGEASITITRAPGAPAASGPGTLATLTFTAIGSGEAPVIIQELGLKDAQSQAIGVNTVPLGVQIQ